MRDGLPGTVGAPPRVIRGYDASDPDERRLTLRSLAERDRRRDSLHGIAAAPGGLRTLIAMREDTLALRAEEPALVPLDRDLLQVLSAAFSPAGLESRPIDGSSLLPVLQHVMRRDAVHPMTGWDDLQRRIGPVDRRCFGLFHPALHDRPVAFAEIALSSAVPATVGDILAPDRVPMHVGDATTAVFYSISSSEPGLRGIRFGEDLLERAVDALHQELPRLHTFITLSPMPGFRAWLERGAPTVVDDADLLRAAEAYLRDTRRGDGRPIDPVARFHLGNGARLDRIQIGADLSPRGREQSYGVMACYRYERRSA